MRLKNDPTLQNKQEISAAAKFNLTKEWEWGLATTRDLQLNQPTSASTNLTFKNECISVVNSLGKQYIQDRDIKPAITYMFRVSFKNLD
jgi:lipopolysaccharide assembly outer membrane protein LptD (OstA)